MAREDDSSLLNTFSFTVSVIYFSVYGCVFFVASIVCAYKVSQQREKHKKYHAAAKNLLENMDSPPADPSPTSERPHHHHGFSVKQRILPAINDNETTNNCIVASMAYEYF